MNKSDLKLIVFLILIFIIIILNMSKNIGTTAKVYYENKMILSINLDVSKEYTVKGYNGDVKLVVNDKKIKVLEESSPLHLCSKQGYISKSYEMIVCLPNKIVIKIDDDVKLDGVVR
ncbi:MAG: NusG domain II-containing protein [Bacilli bacterium]